MFGFSPHLCRDFPFPFSLSSIFARIKNYASAIYEKIRSKISIYIRRKIITSGISLKHNKVLVVWSESDLVRPDFVATILGKFDKDVDVRHRWISSSRLFSRKEWAGAVAMFSTEEQALKAAKELEESSRHIKTIMFRDLLKFFIEVEVHHPEYGKRSSRVVIIGKNSLLNKCISKADDAIYGVGNVRHCVYSTGVMDYGILCKVDYAFTSHAIAATLLMNEMFFKQTGFLCVKMDESEKDKSILRTVAQYINKIIQ